MCFKKLAIDVKGVCFLLGVCLTVQTYEQFQCMGIAGNIVAQKISSNSIQGTWTHAYLLSNAKPNSIREPKQKKSEGLQWLLEECLAPRSC